MDLNNGQMLFFRKIVEGGMWFSAASFGMKAVGLATTLLILKFLDTYEFGLYKLVLAFYGIVSLFFFSGIDQIVLADLMRAKAEGRHATVHRIIFEFFLFKISVGAALFLLTFFGAHVVGAWYGAAIAHLVRISSFLFLIVASERIMNLVFNYYLAFRAMALYTFVEEAAKLFFLLFFVLVADLGVPGVLLAVVASSATAFFTFIPRTLSLWKMMPRVPILREGALWQAFLSYGKWAVGLRYLNDFQRNVRPWLIRLFLPTEAVGMYAIAESLYSQVVSLFPLGNALLPVVSQSIRDRIRIRMLLQYGIKYGTPFFMAVAAVSAILVPLLVRFLFPHHVASLPVFFIFLLNMVTTGASVILTAIFYAEREQEMHFFLTTATLALTLVGGVLLIPWLGVYGAAVEFVLSSLFFNAARLWYIWRRYPELCFTASSLILFGPADRTVIREGAGSIKGFFMKPSKKSVS